METVKIHITIEISTEDTVDTGIPVDVWNRMTDDQRHQTAYAHWSDMAAQDNGGMSVVTEGAEEI